MNYYILGNRIVPFEQPFDKDLYAYQKLTEAETAFYLANPGATVNEVLTMQLNPVYEPTLTELKEQRLLHFSQLSFDKRREILDDYKIANAALGIYDANETARIRGIVEQYRNEYYRLKGLIDAATTIEELNVIEWGLNESGII